MKEFTALDEKIKSGQSDDAEDDRFGELAYLYAQEQVKGFKRTPEE